MSSANVRFIRPAGLATASVYTPVIEVKGSWTVYISGQVALDGEGQVVGVGDFEAQARQVFMNIGIALAAADMTFQHIVKLGLYVTDMAHLALVRRVRDEFVDTARPPASTLVQVAGLIHPDLLFEADAIAVATR